MRLNKYINEEDDVKKGLAVDEPEINAKYSKEVIAKNIEIVKSAISSANKLKDSESKDVILADLEDKLDKWKNVDDETKPAPPPPEEDTSTEEISDEE